VRAIVTPTAPAPFTPLALSMEPLPTRPKLAPLSPGRYEWRLTVSQSVQDKLDEARALLGHALPSGTSPRCSSARCAFVSDSGRRCEERKGLQFDHVQPVAIGGKATVENVRLLCPAHDQHEAGRVFGDGFIKEKRVESRTRAAPSTADRPLNETDCETCPQ
jgi:hypothetical protein